MATSSMLFDERVLRLIVTLAVELHFGRPATRIHISQPVLSGTVKRLERDLGVQLSLRDSRHEQLTPSVRILADEARRLVEEANSVIDKFNALTPQQKQDLVHFLRLL